jgi:hypothetical protein
VMDLVSFWGSPSLARRELRHEHTEPETGLY